MEKKNPFPYIHGFDAKEQERLRRQAQFAEHSIYSGIDFSPLKSLLEVGCGVGAQSEILLRRYPNIQTLECIDNNTRQLDTCRESLAKIPWAKGRYRIQEMDASHLEFESNSLDGAFLCWILEHGQDPTLVLSEVRRVVAPNGTIVINEVMNSSFFLDPYSPNLWKYWMAFNDYQLDTGGDPFIGLKLGNLLLSLGFKNIETKIITWHYDNRWPHKRRDYIQEFKKLILSAADQLIQAKYVSEEIVQLTKSELDRVSKDPNAVYSLSFMQARAQV